MAISMLVHGGAGALAPDDAAGECVQGCLEAVRAGHAVLKQGGSAVDAVEAAVVVLEDNPFFNAGYGACLNADGEVELDASVMSGESLNAGGVAVVKGVKNPVRLARAVMERTPHLLLAADGASRFARESGFPFHPPEQLITPRARERYERERAQQWFPKGGTVGAVALDARGHVAAATSTGGTSGKRPGRVGDSPIVGAGTYADDAAGAASATGHGESILKATLTRFTVDALRAGAAPQGAAEAAMTELHRVKGSGGVILVDRTGRLAFAFNTARMARAWISVEGVEGAAFTG